MFKQIVSSILNHNIHLYIIDPSILIHNFHLYIIDYKIYNYNFKIIITVIIIRNKITILLFEIIWFRIYRFEIIRLRIHHL